MLLILFHICHGWILECGRFQKRTRWNEKKCSLFYFNKIDKNILKNGNTIYMFYMTIVDCCGSSFFEWPFVCERNFLP